MPPDKAERRPPWQESGALDITRGDGDKAMVTPRPSVRLARLQAARCPLALAALRLADPAVIAAVARWHPSAHCPAVRRERAARG